jgi:methyl-accepting chemotaxis protein
MNEQIEKAYSPKEMFTTLDIGDSTLRKWCLALEKNGYVFIRNDKNNRLYVESDLVVLRHFQNLIKQHNMQLDNAAILVIDRFGKGAFEASTVSVPAKKEEEEQRDLNRYNDEDIKELKETVNKQNELLQELIKKMDDQHSYYENKFEALKYDRDLIHSLRSGMDQRRLESSEYENKATNQLEHIEKQLSEIKNQQSNNSDVTELSNQFAELSKQLLQIATAQEEEKKKSFFARLFGK